MLKPLYQKIAQTLIDDIQSGRIPISEKIPPENVLTKKFGVSRHTIREALRILSDMNLVERQPGHGTVVKSNDTKVNYTQSINSLTEILKYPEETRISIIYSRLEFIGQSTANLIDSRVGEKWKKLSGVRSLINEKKPICWSDVYIKEQYSSIEDKIGVSPTPVYQLIEKEFDLDIQTVKVKIFASTVPENIAPYLNVESGSAALTVVRNYKTMSNKSFEVSVSIHPKDRFTYSIELQKDWQIPK